MLLLSGMLSLAGGARAEVTEADFLDDLPVVLSASRLSQPLDEAPAAVTVIDQDMIRASGFRDIPDLLRLVPGFVVSYTSDNTWAAGYHGLGDAYSRRFQVLVDGRSIYSPHYGAVYWSDLPLAIEDIERIEVIRGPNAAIHGANAFAAVINIITKTAAQVAGNTLSTQYGEQSMRGLVARHGGGDDGLRYRLTFSAQQRDRFERDVTGKPPATLDNGQYFEASKTYFLNGRMDWQLSPVSDASAQFGMSQGNWHAGQHTDDPTGVLDPRMQDSRALYLQLTYHKVESAQREWRVQAYHSRNRFDANALADLSLLGLGVVSVDQYLNQTRSNIELQVNETWNADLRGVWGGELRQDTVVSPQNYNADRELSGILARVRQPRMACPGTGAGAGRGHGRAPLLHGNRSFPARRRQPDPAPRACRSTGCFAGLPFADLLRGRRQPGLPAGFGRPARCGDGAVERPEAGARAFA